MTFNYSYNYPEVARDSGFKLRNYKDGPLDWRLIGSMEIERILRDQSFEQIDAVLSHLSEAPLGSILDSNILDSGIAKYFMLSQFSLQYLLFCRKFLEETVTDLRESHSTAQMELANLNRSLSESNNEILQLHKKITQMEAIHEVIYPCHLCTKNFVSNDALNLHISRKHSGSLAKPENKCETPHPLCKDRENYLTLINTIKLELEIKQLKERLNNAERDIKEKNSESDARNIPENAAVHSIGIQSNLAEIKERDDSSSTDDLSNSSQNRQQLNVVQEKLQEFENWKEQQMQQNSEFLKEINNKIKDIGSALEEAKTQRELQMDVETRKSSSSSVTDLEVMLNKKVEEITKATAANLEYVVNKIELSYKDKLDQLEQELHKLNQKYILQKDLKFRETRITTENHNIQDAAIKSENETFQIVQISDSSPDHKIETEDPIRIKADAHVAKEQSASESNHTYVKYSNSNYLEKATDSDISDKSVSTSGDDMSEAGTTDISESLLDEEDLGKINNNLVKTNADEKHVLKKEISQMKLPPPKPRLLTRKDAKKLANNRLSSMGVDLKSQTLTPFMKKRYFDDLNERRNKLKLKHSNFYATRNKIKKFVDKLCSTKMPAKAEALLKDIKHAQPKIQKYCDDDDYYLSDKEEAEILKASTPLNEMPIANDSGNFKQRLERILASPIRKPDDHITKAIIHSEEIVKPLPMPRKRVMFNQPEVRERSLNHASSPTESEESRKNFK